VSTIRGDFIHIEPGLYIGISKDKKIIPVKLGSFTNPEEFIKAYENYVKLWFRYLDEYFVKD